MSTPINPYHSPAPEGPVLAATVGPPPRPIWVTLACLVAVVFGSMGILNSLSALMRTVLGTFMGPPPGIANDPQLKAQYELQSALELASNFYRWFDFTHSFINILLGAILLYGGVTALSNSNQGRQFLVWAYRAAIFYLLTWGIVFVYEKFQMLPAIQTQMEKVAASMKGAPPNLPETMRLLGTITFYAILAVMVGITLLQVTAYYLSSSYLASDEIVALFEHPAAEAPALEVTPAVEPVVARPPDTPSPG